MQASMRPAAEHTPWTAAIVIFGKSRMRRSLSQYMTCSCSSLPSGVDRFAAHSSSPARISLRSWPAEKCFPAAASDHDPHRVVGAGGVEARVEVFDHPGVLRVRSVGSVEGDGRDRSVDRRSERR